jgi:hypothetical protein
MLLLDDSIKLFKILINFVRLSAMNVFRNKEWNSFRGLYQVGLVPVCRRVQVVDIFILWVYTHGNYFSKRKSPDGYENTG